MANRSAEIEDIEIAESGWVLLRIERAAVPSGDRVVAKAAKPAADSVRLFEYAQRSSFAERFPRLTVLGIACGLLATALIAEIDCLRGSGYFWR